MNLFWIGIIIRIGDWCEDTFFSNDGQCFDNDLYWWLRR